MFSIVVEPASSPYPLFLSKEIISISIIYKKSVKLSSGADSGTRTRMIKSLDPKSSVSAISPYPHIKVRSGWLDARLLIASCQRLLRLSSYRHPVTSFYLSILSRFGSKTCLCSIQALKASQQFKEFYPLCFHIGVTSISITVL